MVVTHSHLDLEPGNPDNPGRALADYFRLEAGKVVEHWDVIQDVPKHAASPNGMFRDSRPPRRSLPRRSRVLLRGVQSPARSSAELRRGLRTGRSRACTRLATRYPGDPAQPRRNTGS